MIYKAQLIELEYMQEITPEKSMTSEDVIDLYSKLEELGVKIWVDGGWGIDALLGRQTRPHKDLDIAIQEKDVPKLRDFLGERGYKQIKQDSKWNFVLADENGHEVDVHSFIFDDEGNVVEGITYPALSLTGIGIIDGVTVRCILAEYAVQFRTGYESKRDKDFQDVHAICEKFGIELPEEYVRKSGM